ncbi:MAG: response regulator [Campylobacterota bacterium]|nr:response regulator [Campylobacterota bacterium]
MDKNDIKAKLKNLSVLFVDDEEYVVEIMKDILPELFKESYFAKNGLEGVLKAKENMIDIIITDLSMPKMNGINMVKEIRQFNKDVKVVCVSGHNELEFTKKARELNSAFIIKPISSGELFKALGELL